MQNNKISYLNKIHNKLQFLPFVIIIYVMFSFTLAPASNTIPNKNSGSNTSSLKSGQGIDSLRNGMAIATANFQPSLEMKENVDFLLTPVLLVQEAISEDVVITYPSE